MTIEELKPFCGSGKNATPFSRENYTFATNGHILIRVFRVPEIAPRDDAPDLARAMAGFDAEAEWFDLPVVKVDKLRCTTCNGAGQVCDCPECEGKGRISFRTDYNDYSVECESCDGEGVVSPGDFKCLTEKEEETKTCTNCDGGGFTFVIESTDIGMAKIQNRYIAMIAKLPNAKIGITGELTMARFTFDGGDGLVMPMRG